MHYTLTLLAAAATLRRSNAAMVPRAPTTTISAITAGATYTYPVASDPGMPTVTQLAGLVDEVSYDSNYNAGGGKYEHVVVLSFDGFHEYDLEWYTKEFPASQLQQLLDNGIQYTNAKTSSPSDSFPGSQAYMTGASSRTHGVYYDVSYDRELYPPGSNCTGPQGTVVAYDETIDLNSTDVTGGGGFNESMLPLFKTAWGSCSPVYPNNFVRVNNMFEVARNNNMTTAYTDKHPAYTIANGPSGLGLSEAYFPEIDAFSTQSEVESYDDLHWSALKNWTMGNHFNGSAWPEAGGAPAIYGGNFQAFSVSEKSSGYDNNGIPSDNLVQALRYLDSKLSDLVSTMKSSNTYNSTLIILSAKHGQSPIKRSEVVWINPDALINATGVDVPGSSIDDGGYLWLANNADAPTAKANLMALADELGIAEVWAGQEVVRHGFGDARFDSRAPDIVIKTKVGVIYTTPKATKTAEHGGINPDDVQVALIVSNPCINKSQDTRYGISTRQIAPTVLQALGLNPLFLEGVMKEGTLVLPGVPFA